jgi:hypothetical protein
MIAADLTAAAHRPIIALLDRLDGLSERGSGQWIARCPAHDDRNPSLSIRETSDGTILLKCWSGCSAAEVVAAVGLELGDLFPKTERTSKKYRDRHRLRPADALLLLGREAILVSIAAQQVRDGEPLSDEDLDRVATAAARIAVVCDQAGVRDEV